MVFVQVLSQKHLVDKRYVQIFYKENKIKTVFCSHHSRTILQASSVIHRPGQNVHYVDEIPEFCARRNILNF